MEARKVKITSSSVLRGGGEKYLYQDRIFVLQIKHNKINYYF